MMIENLFYANKRILVTGHTGFKGSWLCKILLLYGADITGYSLESPTKPNLYDIADISTNINSVIGDIRDYDKLYSTIKETEPEIIFHLAAQPIVRESYNSPVETYKTNVMGTVNILEAIRNSRSVRSFVNITTDKVYKNMESSIAYKEDDILNGYDPYSNSKSCSELVTDCYRKSYFEKREVGISTCRAGNVIGGGDFAIDRIIPDCIRAIENKSELVLRNPNSIRPYQHVLDALFAYLNVARAQYENPKQYSSEYNIGPNDSDCITTAELVNLFTKYWGEGLNLVYLNLNSNCLHESNLLKLDSTKIKKELGWMPNWNIEKAIEKTVEWTKYYFANYYVSEIMNNQIKEYKEDLFYKENSFANLKFNTL